MTKDLNEIDEESYENDEDLYEIDGVMKICLKLMKNCNMSCTSIPL